MNREGERLHLARFEQVVLLYSHAWQPMPVRASEVAAPTVIYYTL